MIATRVLRTGQRRNLRSAAKLTRHYNHRFIEQSGRGKIIEQCRQGLIELWQ
jgi:hypothetical protein